MNKLKFLSSAVMAVFFAFGLTSCEKEDFNTKVDTDVDIPSIEIPGVTLPDSYKPGDAVISIQPTVWALIDGNLQNATAASTLTFNDEAMKTYTKTSADGFAAMTVKVVATYVATLGEEEKTLTAETTVEVPALTAGQVAIFTPTLVVSAKSPEQGGDQPGGDQPGGDEPGGDEPGGDEPGGDEPGGIPNYELNTNAVSSTTKELEGSFDIVNKSPYYYYYSQGVFENAPKQRVAWKANAGHEEGVASVENKWKDVYYNNYSNEIIGAPLFYVYSQSITRIYVTVTEKTETYNVEYTISRAADGVAGTLTVKSYSYIYKDTKYLELDGYSHGHGAGHGHGHGHDHGHGGSNAGGGIVNGI